MTQRQYVALAALGSAALLLGALAFQHLGGLPPCKLCIWQRYPHVLAVVFGCAAFVMPGRVLPSLGALAALSTAGIGIYHTGVEQGWWQGPSTCSSGDISALSTDQLMDQIMSAPLVRCDEIAWQFLGLSMASWNALIALVLAGLWIAAARAPLTKA